MIKFKSLLSGYIVTNVSSDRSFINKIPQDIMRLLISFMQSIQSIKYQSIEASITDSYKPFISTISGHFNHEHRKDTVFDLRLYSNNYINNYYNITTAYLKLSLMPRDTNECLAIIHIICKETCHQYKGYRLWNRHRNTKFEWTVGWRYLQRHEINNKITLNFVYFIDVIRWNGTKIPLNMLSFYQSPMKRIEYEWNIDQNRLKSFLNKNRNGWWTYNKYVYSNTWRGYNHDINADGVIFYWFRLTRLNKGFWLHLRHYSCKRRSGLWRAFKYSICIKFSNMVVKYNGFFNDYSKINDKFYPSPNCQYFHILERNIACLKSIKIVIQRFM